VDKGENNNLITNSKESIRIENMSLEEQQSFVSAFAWLIKQDKKLNPALYQIKKQNND
jgi:hypothetical protein